VKVLVPITMVKVFLKSIVFWQNQMILMI